MKLNPSSNIKKLYKKYVLYNNKLSLPTSNDIEYSGILDLKKKLKGESEKETLTNILEWQDRNISYWNERTVDSDFFINAPKIAILAFIIFVLVISIVKNIVTENSIRLFIIGISFGVFIGLYMGFKIGLIAVAVDRFRKCRGKWKSKCGLFYYIKEAEEYTASDRLTTEKILNWKLAVCRDYSRLTASILFIIYPDSEMYYIRTDTHETVGIKFKDEIYFLDQHLPLKTIDNYDENALIYSVKRDSNGKYSVKQEPKRTKRPMLSEINTEELTEEITKILKIEQSSHKNTPDFNIRLEKYAKHYHFDEIIKYSLIKAIKNRLENEFCSNIHGISKVVISQNKEDLMLEVYYG